LRLAYFSPENGRKIRYYVPVFTTVIVCVVASVSAWYLTLASENRILAEEFSGRANNQAVVLQSGLDDYWDKIRALRSLFDSSDDAVTRQEFESFSNSLLQSRAQAILNVAWVPRVKRGERVAHELAAARDGLLDYHIRANVPGGGLPVSPQRDEYFPKFYSTEPRTSPIYGLDLKDGGAAEQTLDHARDGNVLSTSPPLVLRIGNGDRHGFWAAMPVYLHGAAHETVDDRRRNLLGFVQGVFQIKVMIDAVLFGGKAPVRLYLFAPNAAMDDPPIYLTSRLGDESIEAKSQAQLSAGLREAFPLNFGDVQWHLVVAPEPAEMADAVHKRSSIVLLCGLLISLGFTSRIWMMRRYGYKLEMANDRVKEQNLRFDAALNNMALGLLMFDSAGLLIASNQRFAELFGVPWEKWKASAQSKTVPEAMQLAQDWSGVALRNQAQIIADLQAVLGNRKTGRIIFERTDEHTFSSLIAPIADGGFVITFEDVTEQRRTEEKISHMAHYDALTDLPNRILFYEKMSEFLIGAPQGRSFAVFSLDLDHFKSINDTLGHPIGDKLLQTVAARMRGCIRAADVVARLGGDEFAILQLAPDHPEDATLLATRLIEAVSAPYLLDGHQVVVGTSIGIAIAPADGTAPDQLMKSADLALYRCKADGGNAYRFFETEMDARMQERRALELDLRKALANEEFTLNYQPVVNLRTGKVTGCEALIRWHQPERGWVPPLAFIPIAEETGLIVQIGEWVLDRACADAAEWPDEIAVAVNVSPAQFKTVDFVQTVKNALAKSRLPARRLELEITELVLMQGSESALALLHRLKDLGVDIAMDDFGTGYSSLGYLRSFPFDRIKIDQSFIRDLTSNKESLAILRAVVGLGSSLNIVTTAEGVETHSQLEVLRTEGCTDVQGYLLSPPKSKAAIMELLTSSGSQAQAVA
jgi:diguanylate cyclase (GGDEF)-like protein